MEKVDFTELRGLEGIREAWVDFNGTPIHIGIANGLKNARILLERIREGKEQFHAIEVMACPGGCIGGAGQPYHHGNSSILKNVMMLYIAKMPTKLSVNLTRILRYRNFMLNTSGNLADINLMSCCILIISTSQTMWRLPNNMFC